MTVWGAQGENCARFLAKGRPVAIDGRLEWREWETQEGHKRQAIDIVADAVQFLGSRDDGGGGSNGFTPRSDVPADTRDFEPAGTPSGGGGTSAATTTSRSSAALPRAVRQGSAPTARSPPPANLSRRF